MRSDSIEVNDTVETWQGATIMGLDTVELVMRIEETFDITIPDAEAEKILTVGELYRYVLARVPVAEGEPTRCLRRDDVLSLPSSADRWPRCRSKQRPPRNADG